ncbi:uncharacterized protein LOC118456999 [Anopheles albimanus]|uniref:uncharacterized protein LOC118456999 n=1 Tax=Anopheles albimanus TaxID=7167 RepID=UPI00163FD562|nr:uncharacterized protein LOC118456999 [Anopheles albimanus]
MEFTNDDDDDTAAIGEPHPLQHIGMINNHINYNKYNSIFYPPGMMGPAMKDPTSGWSAGRRYSVVAKGKGAPRYRHQQLHHNTVHRYEGFTLELSKQCGAIN